MAQDLITPEIITKEALRLLANQLVAIQTVSRAQEDDFRKIGSDLYVRKPVRFTTTTSATAAIQDVEEAWQKVTVNTQENVAWKFNSRDLTLTVDQYSERYIKPAVSALVHKIETSVHDLYKKVYHSSVPAAGIGNDPTTFLDLGAAKTLLSDHAAPYDNRCALLSTDACLNLANEVGGFKNSYGVDSKALTSQEEATVGKFVGFKTLESQFVVRHSTGLLNGASKVKGAAQNVTYATAKSNTSAALSWTSSLIIDAAGGTAQAQWAKEGDVFTIAGVNSVNPASKQSTGKLQQFVLRTDATTAATTIQSTLVVSPPIISSGAYQTVDSVPADNAVITWIGSANTEYSQNLTYHKEAISFGMIPMEMPDSVNWGNTQTDNGMSIRVYKWLDGTADEENIRLDALWFNEVVHHDLITRIWGS